jgi:ketosteroid isomerase-like protein
MEADGLSTSPPSLAEAAGCEDRCAEHSDERGVSELSREQVIDLLFDAFNRRDTTSALWLLDPEIVFEPMTATVTQNGEPYRGHEGIKRYMQDVQTHWLKLTLRPGHIRVAGDAAVTLGTVSGHGAAGSFEDVPTTWIFKFRNGRVVRVQIFSDPRALATALGET